MTARPTVFAIQDSRSVDLSPALEWGTLKTVLPPGDANFAISDTLARLKEGLKDAKPGDYVLLVGDPAAIMMTGLVLYELFTPGDNIQLLKWNRQTSRYIPITIPVAEASYEQRV